MICGKKIHSSVSQRYRSRQSSRWWGRCPTTGACAGFGFKQGDQFYVNEGLRCGDREKQSMATILVYLALHYCDLDSRGFCQYGNTREMARLTGLTVRTVRDSVWKLAKADYIDAGGIDRDGDFAFHEPDYEKIGLPFSGEKCQIAGAERKGARKMWMLIVPTLLAVRSYWLAYHNLIQCTQA